MGTKTQRIPICGESLRYEIERRGLKIDAVAKEIGAGNLHNAISRDNSLPKPVIIALEATYGITLDDLKTQRGRTPIANTTRNELVISEEQWQRLHDIMVSAITEAFDQPYKPKEEQ